jgi:hypothetical protein
MTVSVDLIETRALNLLRELEGLNIIRLNTPITGTKEQLENSVEPFTSEGEALDFVNYYSGKMLNETR